MQIGLIGLAGAGKDTTALIVQRVLHEQGLKFEIDRYSAPLKKAARLVFGNRFDDRDYKELPVSVDTDTMIEVVHECLHALKFTAAEHEQACHNFFEHMPLSTPISPRLFQQILGTEVVRNVRKTAWVDRIRGIKDHNVIITDVRFENEVTFSNMFVKRFKDVPRPLHPSEHFAWDMQFAGKSVPVDTVDINNWEGTTMDELETRIRFALTLLNFDEVI